MSTSTANGRAATDDGPTIDDLCEAAEHYFNVHRLQLVPIKDKKPYARRWQHKQFWPDDIRRELASGAADGFGVKMGAGSRLIDVEWDNDAQKRKFFELCDEAPPVGPAFTTKHGEHRLFAWEDGLADTCADNIVIKCDDDSELIIRVGGLGGGSQSAFPPTKNRHWKPGLSIDDVPAPSVPEKLRAAMFAATEHRRKEKAASDGKADGAARPDVVAAMRKSTANMVDGNDGSKRLLTCCCRGVEFDATDDEIIAAIRVVEIKAPFPKPYSDDEIVARIRSAEDRVVRGAEKPEPPAPPAPYVPFPVHTLPGPVGEFVAAASAAIGCDPSFIALPLLACLARAIGNKRQIRLKRDWTESPIVWACIVGKSGTHKTPAMQAAMKFLQKRETEAFNAYAEAAAQFEQDIAMYDRDLAAWKKMKGSTEPAPWKPDQPTCERYLTSDTTIEALASLLAAQFDGILVNRDELAGWLGSFDQYKGGKGGDKAHWLSMWSGGSMTVDRKTGPVKVLHIRRAAASVVGGIQPGVLRGAISGESMQDGLCARLLMAMPDPRPVQWSERIIDPKIEAALGAVFDKLLAIEPAADADGHPEPYPLDLTPEAKAPWVEYFNRHRGELADLDDDLAAAWSKLEAYTARFALIFQLCSWASGDATDGAVDEAAMRAAIELSDWFGGEAKRVYGLFVETDDDRQQRELIDLIRRKGGTVTARELTHGCRQYRGAGLAQAALERLVSAGLGSWETTTTAGRPTSAFVLKPGNTGNGNESP